MSAKNSGDTVWDVGIGAFLLGLVAG
jgi:hypothetical protein